MTDNGAQPSSLQATVVEVVGQVLAWIDSAESHVSADEQSVRRHGPAAFGVNEYHTSWPPEPAQDGAGASFVALTVVPVTVPPPAGMGNEPALVQALFAG
jgi:hypothetical protein